MSMKLENKKAVAGTTTIKLNTSHYITEGKK